ncbi:MAG: hypothetical protein MPEBLZ_00885 [Candidatus Methanoperedens nitroreducens]|uniref:NPCBM-associated, NEW3 domain of alpha-galactosidase n=1 Tax=Candidatus Methanoperedens nitratireducens TaxID=1392998 RepID=A0A0P8ACK9_9EURY|nr:hypothetical protein [Candidatus Methanoperedens sp. BLZ2]KAB2944341.1 MAG: hypothetical protein F9K14_14835 [Candidatus Methanoperedens sp.]KPQ44518.1 MAG: hypothetical protein MPEBLZ_00885 [Candidatus Methanoperedens sp. BLZ1]MBZ0175311.1 hypothetical protein [Candidatus Methanoperedens nitroreducens]MCX9079454.1 hypothetical protein [Candidatus Methanoperedens sp.]
MKKFNIFLIIVSTLMIAQVASAASNYLVTESAPVYPGDTTYVYVPIQNKGFGNFMEDVTVKLAPKDNASINAVTLLNDIYSLGTITDWGDQRTAKFRIYINPDVVEGDYYFNVFITYKGLQTDRSNQQMSATTKLDDQILTIRGKPMIMLVNSTISTVAPGSKNTETLTFKNTGTGTVQNTVAEINIDNTNSAFSVLGGGKQFSLGTMKSGDIASITFNLAVDVAARPGVYNIPVKITGQNNYSTDNLIGLVVAGITDFDVSYVETVGSFSLNVANIGISPANAVAVNLPRQKNFSITGSSTSVLGNLNPGDYTSAIFQITKTAEAGSILELEIQYTDTSGQRHTITKSLPVILSSTSTQSRGKSSTNYTLWIVIVVIILVLYWQRGKIKTYFKKQK